MREASLDAMSQIAVDFRGRTTPKAVVGTTAVALAAIERGEE
jgi:hypothetical protein